MVTGIIGAKGVEIERIAAAMKNRGRRTVSGVVFFSGNLCGQQVVLASSGVGKVSAAVGAQIMISVFGAERLINTGVAGALTPGLRQGDIIVASGFVEHDMDTTAVGDAPGYLSGLDIINLPCDGELSSLLYEVSAADAGHGTVRGLVATGDQFIASREQTERIRSTFGADACEMEGGAIAHVCYMAGIPFAAIRCISDNADGSACLSYGEFIDIAANRCASIVLDTFGRLAE